MQPHRARVVSQSLPLAKHVGLRCSCQRLEARKARDERLEFRDDPIDLRLRQHKLAHERVVRVTSRAPRQSATSVRAIPFQHAALKGSHDRGAPGVGGRFDDDLAAGFGRALRDDCDWRDPLHERDATRLRLGASSPSTLGDSPTRQSGSVAHHGTPVARSG